MSVRIRKRLLLSLVLAVIVTCPLVGAKQSESFYDARFPRNCIGEQVPSAIRQQLKSRLRSEFRKINPGIGVIGVLEIACAFDEKEKLLGTVVLAYGTVADQDLAYERFRKTKNIHELLASEQYGIFQYDPSFTTLRRTITVFPSQRWRDYLVRIALKSAKRLSVQAKGSYGDGALKREFDIAW
jgi:hypothetical protein